MRLRPPGPAAAAVAAADSATWPPECCAWRSRQQPSRFGGSSPRAGPAVGALFFLDRARNRKSSHALCAAQCRRGLVAGAELLTSIEARHLASAASMNFFYEADDEFGSLAPIVPVAPEPVVDVAAAGAEGEEPAAAANECAAPPTRRRLPSAGWEAMDALACRVCKHARSLAASCSHGCLAVASHTCPPRVSAPSCLAVASRRSLTFSPSSPSQDCGVRASASAWAPMKTWKAR